MLRADTEVKYGRPLVCGPLLAAALLASGCPYGGWREGPGTTVVGHSNLTRIGYASVGFIGHAGFSGEIDGIDPGMGVTFTVPPAFPVAIAMVAPVIYLEARAGDYDLADDIVEGLLEESVLGVSGVSDATHRYISDFSVDLTFAVSRHRDLAFGGALDYRALMLGVRLAGPRDYVPRYYVCGGFGWYDFAYDNRPDAGVPGSYIGAGLEVFIVTRCSIGVEFRSNYYFGEDAAGVPVDGSARQVALYLAGYY